MRKIIFCSALISLGSAFFVVSCADRKSSNTTTKQSKENQKLSVRMNFNADRTIDKSKIKIKGKYKTCKEKAIDTLWDITSTTSNIQLIKNDANCQLVVTSIEITDAGSATVYKPKAEYVILENDLSTTSLIEYVSTENASDKFYSKINLTNKNTDPKINAYFSRHEITNIEAIIEDIDEELTVTQGTFGDINSIPNVALKNNSFSHKALKKGEEYKITYSGNYQLVNSGTEVYNYILVTNEAFNIKKNIKLKDISDYYENATEEKLVLAANANVDLNSATLGLKDKLLNSMDHSTKKIIIASEKNDSTSYKMFEIVVSLPLNTEQFVLEKFTLTNDTTKNPYGISVDVNKNLVAKIDPFKQLLPDLPPIDDTSTTVCKYIVAENEAALPQHSTRPEMDSAYNSASTVCPRTMFNGTFKIDITKAYLIMLYKGDKAVLDNQVPHFIKISK